MICKNCGHEINIDGTKPDAEITHETLNGGASQRCVHCNCNNPERATKPIWCKNCGCEVKKTKHRENQYNEGGLWYHVILDNPNVNQPKE